MDGLCLSLLPVNNDEADEFGAFSAALDRLSGRSFRRPSLICETYRSCLTSVPPLSPQDQPTTYSSPVLRSLESFIQSSNRDDWSSPWQFLHRTQVAIGRPNHGTAQHSAVPIMSRGFWPPASGQGRARLAHDALELGNSAHDATVATLVTRIDDQAIPPRGTIGRPPVHPLCGRCGCARGVLRPCAASLRK